MRKGWWEKFLLFIGSTVQSSGSSISETRISQREKHEWSKNQVFKCKQTHLSTFVLQNDENWNWSSCRVGPPKETKTTFPSFSYFVLSLIRRSHMVRITTLWGATWTPHSLLSCLHCPQDDTEIILGRSLEPQTSQKASLSSPIKASHVTLDEPIESLKKKQVG